MRKYQTSSEYLAEIKSYIVWKRAKEIAVKELEDHIEDQCEALIEEGYSPNDALQKSISEIGDAKQIGEALNRAHRPKTNWMLIEVVTCFVIVGLLFDLQYAFLNHTPLKMTAVGIGCMMAFVLYWVDYTVLIRFPRILFWTLTAITGLCFVYEARNGFAVIGYSYTFYLLLLFPIVFIGVAYQLKNSHSSLKLLTLLFYVSIPLFGAFLIASLPALTLLSAVICFLFLYAFRKKWFCLDKLNLLGVLCFGIFFVMSLWYLNMLTNFGSAFTNVFQDTDFFISFLCGILKNTSMFGAYHGAPLNSSEDKLLLDYPLVFVCAKTGLWVLFVLVIAFAFFLYLLYRVTKKQNTEIGKMMAMMILIVISVQFLFSVFNSFGVFHSISFCFPFVASGGMFTIYNFILVGIVLSVSRNEDIVKDWIQLKSKGSDL